MNFEQKWQAAIDAGYRIVKLSGRWTVYHEAGPGDCIRMHNAAMSKEDARRAAVAMHEAGRQQDVRAALRAAAHR
jgi:hypothetical protein